MNTDFSSAWILRVGAAITASSDSIPRDVALVVEDGHVRDSGPAASVGARWNHLPVVEKPHSVLIPGLVNAHDHGRGLDSLEFGIVDDSLEPWLKRLGRMPALPPYETALLEGLLLARSGVAWTVHSHIPRSWNDPVPEIEQTLAGYRDAGVGVAFHFPFVEKNLLVYEDEAGFLSSLTGEARRTGDAMASPPPLGLNDYIQLLDTLYDNHHDPDNGVAIQAGPAGPQWCRDESLQALHDWARRRDSRMHMHALESSAQRRYAENTYGMSFVKHLSEVGVLSEAVTLAHAVWVSRSDIEILADAGVSVSHNPSSNIRLGSGIAPVRALRSAGVAVGVGMDGLSFELDHDFLRELRLGWGLSRLLEAQGWPRLEAQDVVSMATVEGSRAAVGMVDEPLGLLPNAGVPSRGDQPGNAPREISSTEDARADFALVQTDPAVLSALSEGFPLSAYTLQTAGVEAVTDVYHHGSWAVRDGELVGARFDGSTGLLKERLARLRTELLDRESALETNPALDTIVAHLKTT